MRILIGCLAFLWGVPASAQSAAQLDARCAGNGPGRPSYEPPPWLGDDAPESRNASAAEYRADRLANRFGQQPIPLHWARVIAEYRWEQCLLGSAPRPCREGVTLYERSLQARGYQPPSARRDQTLFRLATLLVRDQRLVRAREVLERLIKAYPSSPLMPSALILLGQSHSLVRNSRMARQYFAQAADLVSAQQGTALYLAAWAARDVGNSAEARTLAARALTVSRGEVLQAIRDDWCGISVP